MRPLLLLIWAGFLAIGGCASTAVTSARPDGRLWELITRQNSELTTFASLVRVKLQRDGRFDDFRVEVFSESDQRLSLYVRGFLGQAVLKAIIAGDSLTVYFARENRIFVGFRSDLDVGELRQASHIVDVVLTLLHGYVPAPDETQWKSHFRTSKQLLRLQLIDGEQEFEINGRIAIKEQETPPLEIDELELLSHDRRFRARLDFQSVTFSRELPAAKFAIEIPPTAVKMSRDEVVELLTGLTP